MVVLTGAPNEITTPAAIFFNEKIDLRMDIIELLFGK